MRPFVARLSTRFKSRSPSPVMVAEFVVLGLMVFIPIPALVTSLVSGGVLNPTTMSALAGGGMLAAAVWAVARGRRQKATFSAGAIGSAVLSVAVCGGIAATALVAQRDADRASLEFYLHPSSAEAVMNRVPASTTTVVISGRGESGEYVVTANAPDALHTARVSIGDRPVEVTIPLAPSDLVAIELRRADTSELVRMLRIHSR